MRRWVLLVTVVLACLSGGTPAHALQGWKVHRYDPASIPDSLRLSPADTGRYTLNKYAACLLDYSRKSVDAFLKTHPQDQGYQKAVDRLVTHECLWSGKVSFDIEALRGSLYNALYLRDFLSVEPAIRSQPIDYTVDAKEMAGAPDKDYVLLREFADCVVRANPAASRALVLGPVGGVREKAAFAELAPLLNGCMPKGVNAKLSKEVFAGMIAEGLYRLSILAAEPSVVAGNP